ncbi:MAG: hypothetical protein QM718_02290 [Steroidobacteraceae bacterium]
MSQQNPIRVFVTHAWEEADDYLRVFEYLESARNFFYKNLSVPATRPQNGAVDAEREELRRQMANAEVVIALSSLGAQHLDLLTFQLNYAKACDKPVVLLPYFGADTPLPKPLYGLVDETVRWDERSLADAARRQGRHEDTTRWDTIEFKLE